MTLASQGTFLPKINVSAFLTTAHNDFKEVAKQIHGQAKTAHYLTLATQVQKLSHSSNHMAKDKLIEALESIRHNFYQAATHVKDSAFQLHLLQKATETQKVINQLRGRRNG